MDSVHYTDFDREIWEEELADFVPHQVFDAHVHLWSEAHRGTLQGSPSGLRLPVDFSQLRRWSERIFPGRQLGFLALGTPLPGMDISGHNNWMAAQMSGQENSAASMVVSPDMDPHRVAAAVRERGFVGLKPYRSFAPDQTAARICDYLPEPILEVADEYRLAVTLHLSKLHGPADEENLADLQTYTHRYPKTQWILAHCARGFNARHLEPALPVLRDLPNVWYDTAAVNDVYSHYLLFQHEDRRRLLFGSDNIVAGSDHGIYAPYGHAWFFYPGTQPLEHCDPTPTLVVYEQLRQQRRAAMMAGLDGGQVRDLFWSNAQRLLAYLKPEEI